jgi:hypothetical protein
MVEHLFCKQAVAGSNPIAGSIQTHARALLYSARQTKIARKEIFPMPDGVMVAQTTLTRFV